MRKLGALFPVLGCSSRGIGSVSSGFLFIIGFTTLNEDRIFRRLEQRKLYAFILLVIFLNKMTSLSSCPCLTAPRRLEWKRGLCSAFLLQDSLSCFLLHGHCSHLPEISSLKHLWEVDGTCSLSARQRSASHRLRVKQTGLPLCSRLRRWQSRNCCWVRDNSIWLISVEFSEDAWCPDSHSGRKPVLCVYVWCFFFSVCLFLPLSIKFNQC